MKSRWGALDGAVLLRQLLVDKGKLTELGIDTTRAHTVLAERLGKSVNAIYTWKTGSRRPDASARELLERLFGIPRAAWLTADESMRMGFA